MPLSPRLLRAYAEDLASERPIPSVRDEDQKTRILRVAQHLMVRVGRLELNLTGLAVAMKISPATIRRHFADMDVILYTILSQHMMDVSRAIGGVPWEDPARQAAQRAAYIAATQNGFGGPNQRHLLLLRDRNCLPPDLIDAIETLRNQMGETLAGPLGTQALALLDTPEFRLPQIEAILALLAAPETTASQPPVPAADAPPPTPLPRPWINDEPTPSQRAAALAVVVNANPAPQFDHYLAKRARHARAGPH